MKCAASAAPILLLFLATAREARAQEVEPAPVWYGSETLATDGGAAGLLALGILVGWPLKSPQPGALSQSLLAASALTYGFGAPIVHWAHGRVGTGFASLGLRAGLPLAGALVGLVAGAIVNFAQTGIRCDDGGGRSCQTTAPTVGTAIGASAGGALAIVLDAAVLSYERPAPPSHAGGVRLVPRLSVGRTTSIGVAAQF